MRTLKSLLVIFICGWCSFGNADVKIVSPYGLVLSSDEIHKMFSEIELKGAESHQLDDFNIETPFKTALTGLSLSGDYSAQLAQGASVLNYSLTAKMSQMYLRINKIATDTVILKNIGGVNIEVFLKGFCENIEIRSNSEAALTGNIQLQSSLQGLDAVIDSVLINQLPTWQISMGQCHGPTGYDKALKEEVLNILSNKSEIKKFILDPIRKKVQQMAVMINKKIFKSQELELATFAKVQLNPESLEVSENKKMFLLSGVAIANLESLSTEVEVIEDAPFLQRLKTADKTGIYLSQEWLKSSVLKAQSLNLLKYSFTSSSIEGLRSLFSSRLYQFFLWPDLMKFARKVEFLFQLNLNQVKELSYKTTHDGAVWFNFSGAGQVLTKAPKKNQYLDYGQFGVDLKTSVWIKMHKGIAVIGTSAPSFNLNFLWNTQYINLFKPSRYINVNYFSKKIQSVLQKERQSIAMPQVEVSEKVSMFAEEISGDAEVLFVRYSTKDK